MARYDGDDNDNIYTGTPDPDQIYGNGGNDTLSGLEGDDTIDGGAGNDTLLGGSGWYDAAETGNDTLHGGDGDDAIDAGGGDNRVTGGAGNDTIYAYDGNDVIDGNDGNDWIESGGGDDVINGGAGYDTIYAGEGADRVEAGDGDDAVTVSDRFVSVQGGAGYDTLTITGTTGRELDLAAAGFESVYGTSGDDRFDGSAYGADVGLQLFGNDGHDTLLGGSGNDTLIGGSDWWDAVETGDDTLDGGTGNDTLYAGDGDNRVTGGDGDDWIYAGAGADTLDGGTGNDTLDAGDGADRVDAGDGDDSVTVADQFVSVQGGAGYDRLTITGTTGRELDLAAGGFESVYGTSGDDRFDGSAYGADVGLQLFGNDGDDTLLGGSGNDTLIGGSGWGDIVEPGNDTIDGGDGDDQIHAAGGDNRVTGGNGNDWIESGAGADVIDGGDGNDWVQAGAGDDTLDGGAGNDTLYAGDGADRVEAGDGDDTVTVSDQFVSVQGGAGYDRLTITGTTGRELDLAAAGFESVYGTSGDDRFDGSAYGADVGLQLFGNDGDDTLLGGSGNDTLIGGSGWGDIVEPGNDTIDGGDGDDQIHAGAGDNHITGGNGNDWIESGAGADIIDGGDGDDWIYAEAGDDTLDGGTGNDTLNAGDGADRVDAGDGDDTVTVSDQFVSVQGGAGHDTVSITGTTGRELDVAAAGFESVSGTSGDDRFDGSAHGADVQLQLFGNDGHDTLLGGSGNDSLIGGSYWWDAVETGNDTIDGGDGDDSISAGAGDNRITGGNGNDWIESGAGADAIDGGDGNDYIDAGGGNDTFTDGVGSNTLYGGDGNDSFLISSSNSIDGSSLTGGSGVDRYVLSASNTSAIRVTDFAAGAGGDVIVVGDLLRNSHLAPSLYLNALLFLRVPSTPITDPTISFLRWVQDGADTLLQWDRDAQSGSSFGWQTVLTLENFDVAATPISDENLDSNDPPTGSVNHSPTGTDKTLTLLEDGRYTFQAADFGFTDPNDSPANSLQAVKITTLPTAGALTLNGIAVTAGQVVALAELGQLVYAPPAHANGAGYARFTFQVRDNGGTANGGIDTDPSANTLTFDVTAVNDAPAGTDKTLTLLEDGRYTFQAADFGFTDPNDTPANSLQAVQLSTLPAVGTLTLDGAAVTAGQVIAAADLGQLVYTPPTHVSGNGFAEFTFQVQDDGGIAHGGIDIDPTANTITLDVTPVSDPPNQPPQGTDGTIAMLEDGVHTFEATEFGFSDADGDDFVAVRVTTLPTAGALALDGTAVTPGQTIRVDDLGKLTYTPAPNAHGADYASFDFQVQDGGGTDLPTNGLVGYWAAEGDASDSSNLANDGAFSGSYVPGETGQAFDLSTGKVSIPDRPEYAFTSGFSVGFRFDLNDIKSGIVFLGQDDGYGFEAKWFISYNY